MEWISWKEKSIFFVVLKESDFKREAEKLGSCTEEKDAAIFIL